MGSGSALKISVTDILNTSFSVYLSKMKFSFIVFLAMNSINTILTSFITSFLQRFNPPYSPESNSFPWLVDYVVSAIPAFSIIFLTTWVLTNLGLSLIVKWASDIFEGKEVDIKSGLSLIFRSLKDIISVSFLTGALIMLGLILLVLPGVILAIIFSLSIPALIIERLKVFGSLKRSKDLTDGTWWKISLLLLAILILFAAAYFFAELASSFFRQKFAGAIITIVAISLIEPVYPISITYLYYVLRGQKPAYRLVEARAKYVQPTRKLEVKFCYSCGQVLPYDAIYCPNCGARVAAISDNLYDT